MAKTAQEKFSEYLSESAETTDAVNEVIAKTLDNHPASYAYVTGTLSVLLQEAIGELPRAKRAAFRDRLYRLAQEQSELAVIKALQRAA